MNNSKIVGAAFQRAMCAIKTGNTGLYTLVSNCIVGVSGNCVYFTATEQQLKAIQSAKGFLRSIQVFANAPKLGFEFLPTNGESGLILDKNPESKEVADFYPHEASKEHLRLFFQFSVWVLNVYSETSAEYERAKFFADVLSGWIESGKYTVSTRKEIALAYHLINSAKVCQMIKEKGEEFRTPENTQSLFIEEWDKIFITPNA